MYPVPRRGTHHVGELRHSKSGRSTRRSFDFVFALTAFAFVFILCIVYLTARFDFHWRNEDAKREVAANRFRSSSGTVNDVLTKAFGGEYADELGVEEALKGPHSKHIRAKDFKPWEPFANSHDSKPYEVVDCPPVPPPDYPRTYSMYHEILKNWNADSTDIPPVHYDSLCHFDFQNETQREIALAYRNAELPFVGYNIPEIDSVVNKWSNLDYLRGKLGRKPYRTESSDTNHFMYWSGPKYNFRLRTGKIWEPPTKVIQTTFPEWIDLAVSGQNETTENRKHEYFRVSSNLGNQWLFEELPFYKPKPSMFIVDPSGQAGIHCRFGMRSVTAEAHFDGGRNAVVMLGGMRRWILTHPNQCEFMHMYPKEHPSARHSEVDWPKPDVKQFPNFEKVRGNEVILTPGDFLWVPEYWIHYIVSLNVNYQCNTRSGRSHAYDDDIEKCGF